MEDLRKIIDASVRGDQRAQEKLYQLMAPKMYGVCLRYSKDAHEAEDNLQDGFVKVFSKLGSFRHEGSFEGWVRRIMVNVSLERYRRQSKLFLAGDMEKYDQESPGDEPMNGLTPEVLLKMIQELPPRYQMVFNLYVMEGYTHQEIGRMLDITEGSSKSNLSRARDILRKKLELMNCEIQANFSG